MILVLADDFSGASEIAGIAHRYGIDTRLITMQGDIPDCGLLVVDTNTRALSHKQAIMTMQDILGKLSGLPFDWIYKKIDSVLRGHVLTEITQIMDALNIPKSLVIPGNPSMGRLISNGKYYIHGQPVHLTGFADDPEFPVKSAAVHELLHSAKAKYPVQIQKKYTSVSPPVVIIAEAASRREIYDWCEKMDDPVLPAGASDYFIALLTMKLLAAKDRSESVTMPSPGRRIYVAGSLIDTDNVPFDSCVMPVPIEQLESSLNECFMAWMRDIDLKLKSHQSLAIRVGQPGAGNTRSAILIREMMADLVHAILGKYQIDSLLVSGGSTASCIVRKLGWHSLRPVHEYHTGVVSLMDTNDKSHLLTVKPGSYNWPDELIN